MPMADLRLAMADAGLTDAFGHAQLGGVAPVLAALVKDELGHKYHWAVADYLQRARHPFNVNRLAEVAALAALDDREHVERTRDFSLRLKGIAIGMSSGTSGNNPPALLNAMLSASRF